MKEKAGILKSWKLKISKEFEKLWKIAKQFEKVWINSKKFEKFGIPLKTFEKLRKSSKMFKKFEKTFANVIFLQQLFLTFFLSRLLLVVVVTAVSSVFPVCRQSKYKAFPFCCCWFSSCCCCFVLDCLEATKLRSHGEEKKSCWSLLFGRLLACFLWRLMLGSSSKLDWVWGGRRWQPFLFFSLFKK